MERRFIIDSVAGYCMCPRTTNRTHLFPGASRPRACGGRTLLPGFIYGGERVCQASFQWGKCS